MPKTSPVTRLSDRRESCLDRCLVEAGIDRKRTYVTNVVKHFKWVPRGPRRIHSKPGAVEIEACFPWLEAEIARGQAANHRGAGRDGGAGAVRKGFPGDQGPRPAGAIGVGALRARDSASLGIAARPGRGDTPRAKSQQFIEDLRKVAAILTCAERPQ